jgi:hypothetical protein
MISIELYSSNHLGENNRLLLDKNAAYQYLTEVDKKLRAAKDSMEPYFIKYERGDGRNIFRTVISNFESFKSTRFQIAQNRNTPCVTNAWIKAYELYTQYKLIPEDKAFEESKLNKWIHFDNCCFPGSFILAMYHYVYTRRNADFQQAYLWLGSSYISDVTQDKENPGAVLGDQYGLYKNYSQGSLDDVNHFLMDPANDLNGDITDINYLTHINNYFLESDQKVNLYTSDYGVDVAEKKMYNEQEFVHAKGQLAQVLCGFLVMDEGSDFVCKIFTFFNPFTISLLAIISECFENAFICKPASSKPDNSEIYIIGKKYKVKAGESMVELMTIFLEDPESDYKNGTLIDIEKLSHKFWKSLKDATYAIFEDLQIKRIYNNIAVFDKLVARYGDPNKNYETEEKIKRASRDEYKIRIDEDNKKWYNNYPVFVLHKKYRLKIIDITESKPPKQKPPRPAVRKENSLNFIQFTKTDRDTH